MEPIGLDDVLGRDRYAVVRDAVRRRIIEHKRTRRVPVGDRVTFLFEDRATVWYQTQEMLWVESITDLDAIRAELGVYNALVPGASELSATMLIEVTDAARVREWLEALQGIDRCVHLEVGGTLRVPAQFEAGRQTDEKLSAVQYVRFPLAPEVRAAIAEGAALAVVVDHPRYRARGELTGPMRGAVAADVTDPVAADAALQRVRDGA